LTVLWRRPAKRGASTPLVVLLHGRGADETDLIDLAPLLPPAFAFASVRAPVAVEGGGYTWFENRGPARPLARSVRTSVDAFRTWLDGLEPPGNDRPRTYLLGFSAGMMMAGALLLDDPARFAGAVLLSGALAFDTPIPVTPQRLADVPVFYGIGSLDEVIPAELAARTTAYLRDKSGAALTMREYPHGHSISRTEISDVRAWFDAHA
jgi:phospholipase/carboxylesterase